MRPERHSTSQSLGRKTRLPTSNFLLLLGNREAYKYLDLKWSKRCGSIQVFHRSSIFQGDATVAWGPRIRRWEKCWVNMGRWFESPRPSLRRLRKGFKVYSISTRVSVSFLNINFVIKRTQPINWQVSPGSWDYTRIPHELETWHHGFTVRGQLILICPVMDVALWMFVDFCEVFHCTSTI